MTDYCGICDNCDTLFYPNSKVLSIDGIYSKTKLNLEYCNNTCLENQKKIFSFLNNFTFSEIIYSEDDIKSCDIIDYESLVNFMRKNPNIIMKKSVEIVLEIENVKNKTNKSKKDLEFLNDCKKMFLL